MDLLYFVLAAFGLTQILVYGTIFDSIRPSTGKLGELFRCSMCLGSGHFYLELMGIQNYLHLSILLPIFLY